MRDVVREVADAVLYEGHVLWPYRRSAIKNRQRWTFGGVYPAAYARTTNDRSAVSFDCLVEGEDPSVEVEVRFLQIVHRQVVDRGVPVDELVRGDELHQTWDEAIERRVGPGPFVFPPGTESDEPYVRTRQLVQGWVTLRRRRLGVALHRATVVIENTSPWSGAVRDEAMRRALASAHAVLRVKGGAFVSALDPPPGLKRHVDACRVNGLWPFLVGRRRDRRTVLASPIILYDYPRVAPESPGDFFDGCEIDQLMVLSILGLSDAEKEEIRAGDPRARAILERTEAMSQDELLRLNGAWRHA